MAASSGDSSVAGPSRGFRSSSAFGSSLSETSLVPRLGSRERRAEEVKVGSRYSLPSSGSLWRRAIQRGAQCRSTERRSSSRTSGGERVRSITLRSSRKASITLLATGSAGGVYGHFPDDACNPFSVISEFHLPLKIIFWNCHTSTGKTLAVAPTNGAATAAPRTESGNTRRRPRCYNVWKARG